MVYLCLNSYTMFLRLLILVCLPLCAERYSRLSSGFCWGCLSVILLLCGCILRIVDCLHLYLKYCIICRVYSMYMHSIMRRKMLQLSPCCGSGIDGIQNLWCMHAVSRSFLDLRYLLSLASFWRSRIRSRCLAAATKSSDFAASSIALRASSMRVSSEHCRAFAVGSVV